MADPYVQFIGKVEDFDGRALTIGYDYETVTLGEYRFTGPQYEALSQFLVQAAWQAAANSERLRQEADGG